MPHPSVVARVDSSIHQGWGSHGWGKTWGGETQAGFTIGGQVVIRHDRSTTKKKRLRQRQRMN